MVEPVNDSIVVARNISTLPWLIWRNQPLGGCFRWTELNAPPCKRALSVPTVTHVKDVRSEPWSALQSELRSDAPYRVVPS